MTIGTSDDVAAAKRVILDALRGAEGVLANPAPEALVTAIGSVGIDMVARFWINPPRQRDALDATDSAVTSAKEALLRAGVDMPYPTTQVFFHDQTEETDSDRARQREGWLAGEIVPRSRAQMRRQADAETPPLADREGVRQ